MPTLKLRNRSLYWRVDGDCEKAPLLLLNSLGTDQSLWDILMPHLLNEFYILRMDKRGHGGSDDVPVACSIEDLGRDVLAVMDAASWQRTHLCGISIGGMTGIWLRANAPDRFDRLVLSNTSAKVPRQGLEDRIAKIKEKGIGGIADMILGRFFTNPYIENADPYYHSIRTVLLQTDPIGYMNCCKAICDMDLRPLLERIEARTLVIIGRDDQATLPAMGVEIAQKIKGAELAELSLAHIPFLEEPKAYSDLVTRFLLTQ